MESRPRNPEFRINLENFHPCIKRKVFEILDHLPYAAFTKQCYHNKIPVESLSTTGTSPIFTVCHKW